MTFMSADATGPPPDRPADGSFPFPPEDGNEHLYILIDTNGFMIPVRFRVDIFRELHRLGYSRFVVPAAVIRELEGLCSKPSGVDKTAARVALSMAEKCRIVEGEGYADDVLFEQAVRCGIAVLTNDAVLKNRLSDRHVTVVSLRQKTHLESFL